MRDRWINRLGAILFYAILVLHAFFLADAEHPVLYSLFLLVPVGIGVMIGEFAIVRPREEERRRRDQQWAQWERSFLEWQASEKGDVPVPPPHRREG